MIKKIVVKKNKSIGIRLKENVRDALQIYANKVCNGNLSEAARMVIEAGIDAMEVDHPPGSLGNEQKGERGRRGVPHARG